MTTAAAPPPALIGTWEAGDAPAFVLDLREDGLASFFQGAFFWVADGKTIGLLDPSKTETARLPYTLDGERLTISFEKDQTITLVRRPGTARPGPVATPKWIGDGYAETSTGLWHRQYRQNNGLILTAEYHWERATLDRGTMRTVCGLTVDASHVYDNGRVLPNIDAASFRDLGGGFCADKSSVRTSAVKQVWADTPGARGAEFDVATFQPLLGDLVRDRHGVYTRSESAGTNESELVGGQVYRVDVWERLDLPDAATFQTPSASTARDARYEYRIESRQTVNSKRLAITKILRGGDVLEVGAGFQLADGVISFEGRRLEHPDLGTFEVLLKLPKERIYRGWWARDRKSVWYGSHRIEGADPQTFTAMDEGSNLYAFDQKGRYESGRPLNPAWSDKFEQVRARWMAKRSTPR